MPLQNRVDPFGAIHAVPARGMFTGNRGIIHDPATKSLLARRWTGKAWIICRCAFRGLRRDPMGRNGPGGRAGWTELFFLDEVTALAAGHRPCFFCQRERAREFARCFTLAEAEREPGRGGRPMRAREIDAVLHSQRLASGGKALVVTVDGEKPLSFGVDPTRPPPDGTVLAAAAGPPLSFGDDLPHTSPRGTVMAAAGGTPPSFRGSPPLPDRATITLASGEPLSFAVAGGGPPSLQEDHPSTPLGRAASAAAGKPISLSGDPPCALPDGTVIALEGVPFALRRGMALPWRFSGYGEAVRLDRFSGMRARIITPAATIAALAHGYKTEWHPSAEGGTS